jgi:hypothetical protein
LEALAVTGPGNVIAAAGRGHLRTSHAERDHAVGVLKTAFVQGRLTKDEFELRVDRALSSRTYAELATVTADLPAGLPADLPTRLTAGPPPRVPARGRLPVNNTLRAVLFMAATVTALAVILRAAAFLTGDNGVVEITFLATLADLAIIPMVVFVTAAQALDERQQKRSSGQVTPPPSSHGAGGRISGCTAPAGPALSPRRFDEDRRHIAEASLHPACSRPWADGGHRIRSAIVIIATRSA